MPAAAADADKAIQLGGNLPDAAQLREAVRNAERGVQNVNQQAAQAMALARRHADQGQLTVGQQVLAEAPVTDPRLDCLKQDLAARRAGLESCLKKATEAFDAGDWEAAIDHIAMAGKNSAQDAALRRLADRIADHVAAEAAPQVESGRLDAAAALMGRLDGLPADTTATRHLRATLDQCRAASNAIAAGQHQEAEEVLRRLQIMWPQAGWIGQLAEQARQWAEVQTAIRASPLSLLTLTAQRAGESAIASSASGDGTDAISGSARRRRGQLWGLAGTEGLHRATQLDASARFAADDRRGRADDHSVALGWRLFPGR